MPDDLSRTINIDEIIKKIREEVSARTEEFHRANRRADIMPPRLNETGIFRAIKWLQSRIKDYPFYNVVYRIAGRFKKVIPVFHEEVDAAYLLKLSDKEFVSNSYNVVLKRDPDEQSFDYFLSKLRNAGLSKIEILGRLRYSREGREIGVRVKGLVLPFAFQTACRVPVFGYVLRLVTAILTLPGILRRAQRREAMDDMRFARLSSRLSDLDTARRSGDSGSGRDSAGNKDV